MRSIPEISKDHVKIKVNHYFTNDEKKLKKQEMDKALLKMVEEMKVEEIQI